MRTLKNEFLTLQISEHGAELCSIRRNDTGYEYLWQADPAYWKRHSPVLFPIVGSVWENRYRHGGKTFDMTQHGFARDMDFAFLREMPGEVWFRLKSTEETLKKFPFPFVLEIGYRLKGNQVEVLWKVHEPSENTLFFQIGAHPAFNYPGFRVDTEERGFFAFDRTEGLEYILIEAKGCVSKKAYPLELPQGLLPITTRTFDRDALVLENSQVRRVALLDKEKQPYLSLRFDAPVVGLWSPPAKNAPFVCIEPWYGRCDEAYFQGQYEEKEWIQRLPGGETFRGGYVISIDDLGI